MPSPEEIQRLCDEAFGGRDSVRPRPQPPVEIPRPPLSPEEIQRRCNELFGDMPSRPEPTQFEKPRPLSPEEIQRRLNEAFGTWRPPPPPSPKQPPQPPPKLSPEEIQQYFNEAFAPWEWLKSHPSPGRSRRLRSFRVNKPSGGPSRRQRCDARVKNLIRIGKNGVKLTRGPFCKAWAMESGRCWVHGGASTGRRTPEGRRGSWPHWSRGGGSGLRGDAPRDGGSPRAARAARDG
jgi:hypothetical protein